MQIMQVKRWLHKFILHNFLMHYIIIMHETLKCINKNCVNFSRGPLTDSIISHVHTNVTLRYSIMECMTGGGGGVDTWQKAS